MSRPPTIIRAAFDTHHNGESQWGWDGTHLYHRNSVFDKRWIKVNKVSFTPQRIRLIADLITEEQDAPR